MLQGFSKILNLATANMQAASGAVGITLFLILLIFLLSIGLAIFLFVFWILMLIDCVKRDFKKENDKIVWILIVALLHWLGATIYYFVVKRKSNKS